MNTSRLESLGVECAWPVRLVGSPRTPAANRNLRLAFAVALVGLALGAAAVVSVGPRSVLKLFGSASSVSLACAPQATSARSAKAASNLGSERGRDG